MINNANDCFIQLQQYNYQNYSKYDAWYSGDKNKLTNNADRNHFWTNRKSCIRKLHVPIASDIATYSSDLLFSERPRIILNKDDEELNKSFNELLIQNDFFGKLNFAGEICSAFGDVYLKINWDKELFNYPVINVISPELALPEFTFGIMTSISFISVIKKSGEAENPDYYRLYEKQEKGIIYSELYKGKRDTLGKRISFKDIGLDIEEEVNTQIDDLMAIHVPNMMPNRNTKNSNLGRSDLEGSIDLMDSLDEVYTSWIRDVRLSKARMMIPIDYLRTKETPIDMGQESVFYFDEEEEMFIGLDIETDKMSNPGITMSQFEIRASQHLETAQEFLERIIINAGFSPQSFGLKIEGRAESGTALNIRERRSFISKSKKETFWKTRLEKLLKSFIKVNNEVFSANIPDNNVVVEFQDSITNDLNSLASSIDLINRAQAASVKTKVSIIHPDWTDNQVNNEVMAIQTEQGILVPDIDNIDYSNGLTDQIKEGDYNAPNAQ